jgi:hypothetical protein
MDHFIIFIAKIPLVSNDEYKVFKPITLPIPYDDNSVVLIAPDVEYLALSNDNEKFFVLTENQWKACKEFKNHKLCKNSQPVHQRSKSDMCETSLLTNRQNTPKTCKIKLLSLDTSVWHSLTNTNS